MKSLPLQVARLQFAHHLGRDSFCYSAKQLDLWALSQDKDKKLGPVLGWWREAGTLTHVVVKNAGHMVPRDDPLTAQRMIESWLERSLSAGSAGISLHGGAGIDS